MINRAFGKGRVRLLWGVILSIILISSLLVSFAATSYAAGGVTVTRTLPAVVVPGGTFNVTLTFTSPDNNFNAIGLSDFAPAGWAVAGNNALNTPNSDSVLVTGNRIDYIWNGPITSGTVITAVYQVTVPLNATPGTYYFTNSSPVPQIQYFIAGAGPYIDNIVGSNSVSISSPVPAFSTLGLGLMIAGLTTLMMLFAFRRVRRSQG